MHTLQQVEGNRFLVESSPVEIQKGVRIGSVLVPDSLVEAIPLSEAEAMAALFESPAQAAKENVSKGVTDDPNSIFDTYSFFRALVVDKVEIAKAAEVDEHPENACLDSVFPFFMEGE